MSLVDLFVDSKPKLGAIVLDASVEEVHEYAASTSKYPVESGFRRRDHRRVEAPVVTITGLISNVVNEPLALVGAFADLVSEQGLTGIPGALAANVFGDGYDPARHITAWGRIVELFQGDDEFILYTTLDVYTGMEMTGLTTTRSFERSDALEFTAVCEKKVVGYTSYVAAAAAAELEDMGAALIDAAGQTVATVDPFTADAAATQYAATLVDPFL